MPRSFSVVPAVLIALIGCSSAPSEGAGSRTGRGDTTFVSSPAEGVYGRVTVTEQLRLTADQLGVGAVFTAVFGPDGTIWVYDRQGRDGEALVVLDSLGSRLTTAGRSGTGPGEYRGAARIFRMGDGTMLLRVIGGPRVVRFDRHGGVLATIELPPSAMNGWLVTPDSAGGWYQAAAFEENTPTRVGRFGWIHFAVDGTIRDTIFPSVYFFEEPTPLGITPGRVRTVTWDGAVITALPGRNRVDRIARDGRVTAMTWRGEAPRYAEEERRDVQRVSDRMNELVGQLPVPLPTHKASVRLLLTSADGGVWAALGGEGVRIPDEELPKSTGPLPPIKWVDRERWGAFDRDGVLNYVVEMAPGVSVLDRDGTRLLGVVAGKDGMQALVVWRIELPRAESLPYR